MSAGLTAPATDVTLTHQIFLLDADLVSPIAMNNWEKATNRIVNGLMSHLDMKHLAPLQYCPATDLRFPGFSFIQPITTSHISGHYFEEEGRLPHVHIDIYSCKAFDWAQIIPFLHKHLQLGKWSANSIVRSRELERTYVEISGEGHTHEKLAELRAETSMAMV